MRVSLDAEHPPAVRNYRSISPPNRLPAVAGLGGYSFAECSWRRSAIEASRDTDHPPAVQGYRSISLKTASRQLRVAVGLFLCSVLAELLDD
jgi:hypothetical protein